MKTVIIGRIALIAAIYDKNNLPSAIVHPEGSLDEPFCLHSLRTGDEGLLNKLVETATDGDENENETARFVLYPFFEDFPKQSYGCVGCAYNAEQGKADGTHHISHSEQACRKTTEMCA